MRPTSTLPLSVILPLFLRFSLAQDSGSNSSSYVSECVSAFQSAGYGGLAETLTKINGTPAADQLFSQLSSGRNFTVFAPDDQAMQQIPSEVSSNSSLLAEYLSYHFVDGDFTNSSYTNSSGAGGGGGSSSSSSMESSSTMTSSETGGGGGGGTTSTMSGGGGGGGGGPMTQAAALFGRIMLPRQDDGNSSGSGNSSSSSIPQPFAGVWPNVTLGRTLLNTSQFVMLEGNKSQVLAWTRSSEQGNVTILNQASGSQNITVVNGTTWNNLFINGINGVLIPPGNLSTALTAINATNIENILTTVQIPAMNGTNETAIEALQNARGITVFVPANDAFTSDVNNTLQSLQNDPSQQTALIENHYLNGTTIYSTQVDNTTQAVTAAGQTIDFIKNDTGTFVRGANDSTAQVIRPDVLLSNGVVHIIDRVLLSTDSNTEDAVSAYESATSSVAAYSTTETAPITAVVGGGGAEQSTQTQESSSMQSSSESSSTESSSTESGAGGGGSTTDTTSTQTETQSASA